MAVVFSTLFVTPLRRKEGDWEKVFYADFDQAHRQYRLQLDAYHELTDRHPEHFRLVGSRADLESVLADWNGPAETASGRAGAVDGGRRGRAESRRAGRVVAGGGAPDRAGLGRHPLLRGDAEPGPLTDDGRDLLAGMAGIGFILDLSHMDVLSARQSLDFYPGPIVATHANAPRIIPGYEGNRMLPDEVIQRPARPRWNDRSDSVLQVSGFPTGTRATRALRSPSRHWPLMSTTSARWPGMPATWGWAAISTAGSGWSPSPAEVDTIADLQKLAPY